MTSVPSPQRIATSDELGSLVGQEIGVSEWVRVSQPRIDQFAEATGDHQWIHVDPVRAAAGPFGATIAHGYLTLSMLPMLSAQIFALEFGSARLNYGLNNVRFPSSVRVDSEVRARASLKSAEQVAAGLLVTVGYTVEMRNSDKPACVAESLVLVVGA